MSDMAITFRRLMLATSFALGVTACATAADKVAPPAPVEPQPAAAALQPGLQMLYFSGDFKHVENMPTTPAELAKGQRGGPVANLAASTDGGPMWGIASSYEFFGAHFTGLIMLEAGEYSFLAKSNDGVRVHLDRMRVVDDPDIHVDRLSKPVKVAISKAGWYPITVQYFQRRGTARLEVMWQPPGATAPAIIPASALAHVPK
jgi:PA14 domain-containing protein